MSISEPAAGGGASINPPTPVASSDVSVSHQFSFNDLDLQNASYDVGLLQQHHDTTIHVSDDVDQFISNNGTFLDYISSFSVSGESGGCGVGGGSTIANPDDAARDFGGKKRKKNTSSDLDAFQNPSNKNHPTQKETKHPNPHTMENSSSKEEYIHMRAKRGQATNSHSLAERLRREKISERMRFLQNLVPGCNKITGKAVMLDEIINYVQSLQSQVEFLSMKLSTVNPELNQIPTNDIVGQARYANPGVGATAMSRSNPDNLSYGNIAANNFNSTQLCTTTSTTIWDDELQNVVYS